MQIDSLMKNSGPTIFYNNSFRVVLESFLPILIASTNTIQITVNEQIVYKYEADFFGLLNELNIPLYLHWLVMRMNNLTSPHDSNSSITSILVPDETTIDHIRQSFMSSNRIKG